MTPPADETPVDQLDATIRLENILRNAGISTVGEARALPWSALVKLMGRNQLSELRALLAGDVVRVDYRSSTTVPARIEPLGLRLQWVLGLDPGASGDEIVREVERLVDEHRSLVAAVLGSLP